MAMTVKKDNNEVRIQWRVADIKIPTSEIKKYFTRPRNSCRSRFRF